MASSDDPLAAPTGIGISNAITASNTPVLGSSFAFDPSISSTFRPIPSFIITSSTSTIPTPTVTSTPSPSHSANSSPSISVAAVILTCISAFIAASVFICVALWLYRRYQNNLIQRCSNKKNSSHHPHHQREQERRRSRLEPWNRLRDSDDKWESNYNAKEDSVAPMEKFNMFRRSPSSRTACTFKSDHDHVFDPQSFAQYLPSLPKPESEQNHHDDGALLILPQHTTATPSLGMAIPTPAAVKTLPHRHESAQVINYRLSLNVRGDPTSSSTSSLGIPPGLMDASADPFGTPRASPSVITSLNTKHTISDSNDSTASQDRALRSLIAALDFSEEGGGSNSHRPSVASKTSVYSTAEDEFVDPFGKRESSS